MKKPAVLSPANKHQQGMILVAALLVISILISGVIVLSYIPVADQKIAGNYNDHILAKQAADSAVDEAVNFITNTWINNATLPVVSCNYPTTISLQGTSFISDGYIMQPASWWTTNGCSAHNYPAGPGAAPTYFVKYLGCDNMNGVFVYQIAGRGTGKSSNTVAYSERIFSTAPYNNPAGNTASTPGVYLATLSKPACPTVSSPSTATAYLTPGTNFGTMQGGWGTCQSDFGWCNQGVGGYSMCQRNCAGQIRVLGYSGSDTPIPCQIKYGPWVTPGAGVSSITIQGLNTYNGNALTSYTWSCY